MNKVSMSVLAAAIALSASASQAFTPPYHINGATYVGTATFKASGACKVSPKKFSNAQFGNIADSTNAGVGYGVIDSTGNILLAVTNSDIPNYYSSYKINDADFLEVRLMVSMVGAPMLAYLAAEAGCDPKIAWATPASYRLSHQDPETTVPRKREQTIKQSFSGITNPDSNYLAKNGLYTYTGNKFTGSFTFKGQWFYP